MPAPAEPPAENAAAAEAPDLPADPAEEMELDNEDEDDGGAEDVADANNGAQGTTGCCKPIRKSSKCINDEDVLKKILLKKTYIMCIYLC